MELIILGIDPGINIMGFGLIKIINKEIKIIHLNELILKKNKSDNSDNFRLKKIFNKILLLIDEFRPNELAVEAPFLGKNVQSMLKLGKVLGVIIAAGLSKNLNITEYSPKKVKISITGNGNASKEQIFKTLKNLFLIKNTFKLKNDATDGLAIAICHYFNR